MPVAYSYTRFSTPEQATGDSARRQIELAETYAKVHGLELDETLRLKDEGVSGFRGANVRNGALGQFLNAIDRGEVEPGSFLLVENLDRVSRQNPWDALPVFQMIINAGVTIVTLFDGKQYELADMRANPLRIMESLFVMVRANEESETKSRRLRSVWSNKRTRAADRPLTRIVPAWMTVEDGEIVFIADRAEVVARIVEMALTGMGQHRIAEILNREGIPTFGKSDGWHRSYVSKILENPALVGTLVPHETEHRDGRKVRKPLDPVPGYFPAVVTEEEWSRLAGMAVARKPKVRAEAKLQNILSGLATCARCGAPMVRVQKGDRSRPVLVCSKAKRGLGCEYRSIRMEEVEARVRGALVSLAESYPSGDDDVDQIAAEVRGLETALEVIVSEMVEHGRSAALTRARTEHETLLSDATDRLRAAMEAASVRQKARPEALLDLQEAPLEEVNTVLRSLFSECRITVEGKGWYEWQMEWV